MITTLAKTVGEVAGDRKNLGLEFEASAKMLWGNL